MPKDIDKMTVAELDAFIESETKKKYQAEVFSKIPKTSPTTPNLEESASPSSLFKKALTVPITGMLGGTPVLGGQQSLSNWAEGKQTEGEQEQNRSVNSHVMGAAVPGGPVVKGLSALMGVNSPADLAINAVGGPMAKYGGKVLKLAGDAAHKLPFGGDFATTLMHMLGGGMQHEANTAIHNQFSDTPQSSILQQNGGTSTALAQGASMLLPGVASAVQNDTVQSKFVKAKELLTKLRGTKTDPRQVGTLPVEEGVGAVQPGVQSAVEGMVDAENAPVRELAGQMADKRKAVGEIDVAIRTNQNNIAKEAERRSRVVTQIQNTEAEKKAEMTLLKKEAAKYKRDPARSEEYNSMIEEKQAELLRLGEQRRGLGSNELKLPDTEVPLDGYNPRSVRTMLNNVKAAKLAKTQREVEIDDLSASHKAIQDMLRDNSQISGSLRSFGATANPVQFVSKMRESSPEQFGELLGVITSPKERETFRRAVLDDFSRLAFPGGQPDPSVLKAYPPEKIAKLFGEGVEGVEAASRVKRTVEELSKLVAPPKSKLMQTVESVGSKFANYSVPGYILFHGMPGPHAATAIGAGVVAIAWPKLLDAVVKNPQFGDEFVQWASTGKMARNSLETFPAVRKWLIQNDTMGETEERLSTGVSSDKKSVKELITTLK